MRRQSFLNGSSRKGLRNILKKYRKKNKRDQNPLEFAQLTQATNN
jgi:hypothetical protein